MTNVGALRISSASTVMVRSERRYCRMAPQAPMMTPMMEPRIDPMATSRRLVHTRRPSSSETGCPVTVFPKSPRTAPETQLA